jgi:uncharacterized membrane protein YcaP (DUF421 family)
VGMNPYLMIVVSSITVYIFIVFAIRIFGKNELSQLSIVDLVFILLISNSVQNAMVGTNSTLLGGLVAATSLFAVNWLLRNLLFKVKKINQFIQGSALMLIYKGKVIQKHLDRANISTEDLEAAVREHGVAEIKDVDLAVLEVDGNISILSHNFTKKSTRKRILHRMLNKSS